MKTFRSYSSRETANFASDFAKKIVRDARIRGAHKDRENYDKRAFVVALQGDLGAGKTTFVQGFARGLGIKRRMMSPTFIIMRRFKIPPGKKFKNLYHIDAYRIKKLDSLEAIGLHEILKDSTGLVLLEWPEKVKALAIKNAIRLKFRYGKKENERNILIG